MKLKDITIKNFRGIRSLDLPLDRLTVLIGENNTGKSTVLEAIRLVLTRGFGIRRDIRFTEYDFHLKDASATPQTAEPILIKLHFAEDHEDDWPDSVVQQMTEVTQVDTRGLHHIWLQAKGSYQPESGSYETKWAFLNNRDEELNLKNATAHNLIARLVPIFFLSALRDASQEFGQRGQFWNSFLKSIQLPKDEREKLEEMLRTVNTSVIGANAGLTEVKNKIAGASQLVSLDTMEPVVLEAIPTRIFDMVGKIQVHLKSSDGAKVPLHRHGDGTQSLAVLMLFKAFAEANLAETYAPESEPILALEEPEAHLHPSAIRSLGPFLRTLSGQILVSSHSGDLISRVPITALRRLYKHKGETMVGQVHEVFNATEQQAIDYSVRLTRGHYLFSRCWLLVEGESEFHLMPQLFELMGHVQDQVSFSVLEISQLPGKGEPLIRLAKALGIQWFLMADGDGTGEGYVKRAANHLAADEKLEERAKKLSHPGIEYEFWCNGYSDFIRAMVPIDRKKEIKMQNDGDEAKETKQLITAAIKQSGGGKPAFARTLVNEIEKRGVDSIPETIRAVITRVVQLAEG